MSVRVQIQRRDKAFENWHREKLQTSFWIVIKLSQVVCAGGVELFVGSSNNKYPVPG